MKHILLLFHLIFGLSLAAQAQSGRGVYRFLELPVSSHAAALGGYHAALYSDGVDAALVNPSLLSAETDNQLALNFTNYLADVSAGTLAYGKNWGENLFAAGFQFVDYGDFAGRDEFNQDMGNFSAKDFALSLIYARQLEERWNAGITLKPIYSAYESYSSFALGVDVGLSYVDMKKGFSAGLALVNIGRQFSSYAGERESLPFNSLLSVTKKFAHAPFRLSFTAHHLHVWDLDYTNTIYTTSLSGGKKYEDVKFFDMLFRHTIFGVDFIPTKYLYLTASYNHRRAAELGLDSKKSITGFSFGAGAKVYKFHVGFALAQYQKGILSYQFSLSTDLKAFGL